MGVKPRQPIHFYLISCCTAVLFAMTLWGFNIFPMISALASRTITWTGCTDNRWSVFGAWDNNLRPFLWDDLLFPASSLVCNAISNNDEVWAGGWQVNSITFKDGSFDLIGNQITLGTGGITDSNAYSEGPVNWIDFPIILKGTGGSSTPITVSNPDSFLSITSTISGMGGIQKIGDGTLIMQGYQKMYAGGTTVSGGVLQLKTTLSSITTVNKSGIVSGTGNAYILQVNSGGHVHPGYPSDQCATLNTYQAVFKSSSNLDINLQPGCSDQLNVINDMTTLDPGTLLNISTHARFPAGVLFTVIKSQVSTPIKGQFANLPEGSILSSGGNSFIITYRGGQGSDVVLTTLDSTTSTISAPAINYGENGKVDVTIESTYSLVPPTGKVTLSIEGGAPFTQSLVPAGATTSIATFSVPDLKPGPHALFAYYAAQGDFGTNSSSASILVKPAVTTPKFSIVTLNYLSSGIINIGVDCASQIGSPTGKVIYSIDGQAINTLSSDKGTAQDTFAVPQGTGPHSIKIEYLGDPPTFAQSTLSDSNLVHPSPTTTAVSAPTISYNADGLVIISVASAVDTPTGNVGLPVDGGPIIMGALDKGKASITISNLQADDHTLTANYPLQGNDDTSSVIGTLHVNKGDSVLVLSLPPGIPVYGEAAVIETKVSSIAGIPGGTVTFKENQTILGTLPLVNSKASLNTSTLTTGAHTIVAIYNGDPNFLPVTSDPVSQTINLSDTTLTVSSSASPVTFSVPVTLTATIAATSPGSGAPTGRVSFKDGGTILGDVPLVGNKATLTVGDFNSGNHLIVGSYAGDGNFNVCFGDVYTQTINKTVAVINLVSLANPALSSTTVPFAASVVPAGASTGTETVSFKSGSTLLCTGPLINGAVNCNNTFTSNGTYPITATYNGNGNFNSVTSTPLEETIASSYPYDAKVTLDSPTLMADRMVSINVSIVIQTGAVGKLKGTVVFLDGNIPIGSHTWDSDTDNGSFALSTGSLDAGSHTFRAVFNPLNIVQGGISTPQMVTINPTDTVTSLISPVTGSSIFFRQPVPVIFSVTSTSGTPVTDGDVTISVAESLDTCTAPAVVGNCVLNLSAVGINNLSASYAGTSNYKSSDTTQLPAYTITVKPVDTTTTVVTSTPSSPFGSTVSITARVTPVIGNAVPAGYVVFKDAGIILSSLAVEANGSVTFSTSSFMTGSHSISVEYKGTPPFNSSSASLVGDQTIVKADTTTTLDPISSTPSTFGDSITYSASVIGTNTIPTGNVTYRASTITLCTAKVNGAGIATCQSDLLPAGGKVVTAEYAGDAHYNPSVSPGVIKDLKKIDTSLALSQVMPELSQLGNSITVKFTLTSHVTSTSPNGLIKIQMGDHSCTVTTAQNTCTLMPGAEGAFMVTATYSGDPNFNHSQSPVVIHRVWMLRQVYLPTVHNQ
jgi:autotransporter-associated beta strand protein